MSQAAVLGASRDIPDCSLGVYGALGHVGLDLLHSRQFWH